MELQMSVWDGAATPVSDGFFDEGDVLPWGTWLAYLPQGCQFGALLLSWVPDDYVAAVEAGIEVNPVECIYWREAAGER